MSQEDKQFEEIEKYLNGELHGAELENFLARKNADPEFNDLIESHQLAEELLMQSRLSDVKKILDEERIKSGSDNNYFRNSLFGLVLLGLIGFGLYYLTKDKTERLPEVAVVSASSENNGQDVEQTQKGKNISKSIPKVAEETLERPMNNSNELSESAKIEFREPQVIADHHTEQQEIKTEENTASDACANVKITAAISTKNACLDEDNGSILVENIKGGNKPYTINILNEENKKVFSSLKLNEGEYTVSISDHSGCNSVQKVFVKSINCPKDYVINITAGDEWEIPVSDKSGELTIFDKAGSVYFQKDLSANSKDKWNGESSGGSIETGFYHFRIKFNDGTEKNGTVTILR